MAFDSGESYALFPDVIPTLDALEARGLTLGVVSDWGAGLAAIMRHHDLTRYFDFAVVSATARLAKPNPGLYQLALQRADAIPDYALHVGDSYVRDVLGARAAGVQAALLDRPRAVRPEQVDCPLIHDLRELLPLLDRAYRAASKQREPIQEGLPLSGDVEDPIASDQHAGAVDALNCRLCSASVTATGAIGPEARKLNPTSNAPLIA